MIDAATAFAARAGIEPGEALAAALRDRAGILAMTEAAEAAVLTPREPGAWSHTLRAALAARMAQIHCLPDIAERHRRTAGADPAAAVVDLAEDGAVQGVAAAVAFMDRVAGAPRDVTADDIVKLQAAGIEDADIVRLAELNAFLAFQYRLIAGLRLVAAKGKSR